MARKKKISKFDTRVSFYDFKPKPGPEPGEKEKNVLYSCWAKINSVWLKDLEQAKTNGTLEDLTIEIRDPRRTFSPNNKHYLQVKKRGYSQNRYQIKSVQPDWQDNEYVIVVAELVS